MDNLGSGLRLSAHTCMSWAGFLCSNVQYLYPKSIICIYMSNWQFSQTDKKTTIKSMTDRASEEYTFENEK